MTQERGQLHQGSAQGDQQVGLGRVLPQPKAPGPSVGGEPGTKHEQTEAQGFGPRGGNVAAIVQELDQLQQVVGQCVDARRWCKDRTVA